MKKQFLAPVLLLAAFTLFTSFSVRHAKVPAPGAGTRAAETGLFYPLTEDHVDALGGVFLAGALPEARLQAFFTNMGIKPVSKQQMVSHHNYSTGTLNSARFQCNTGWTYFYSYGSCTANYSRPECGYYVRIRYWKKYRFDACRYEEVTISSTVVCC